MRESFGRKVDEQIRESVATLLVTEFSDPRLTFITVTGAEVSPDRSVANIYVSSSPDSYDDVTNALESAKGRLRSLLGKNLGWRVTPDLRFFIDESVDEAERIEAALRNVPPTLADGEGAVPSVDEDEE